jgi:isocitrate/isopropylmalate dehydrogenase
MLGDYPLTSVKPRNGNEKYKIAIIPGDGIGTEVMDATINVLKVLASITDLEFEFKEFQARASHMFGDILSDETAGLVGGLGITPSGNVGDKLAIFEPVHGSAPDIAGQGVANPIASILSSAMMLEWLGEKNAAKRLEDAVITVLEESRVKTPDLGGKNNTIEIDNEIASIL